MATPPFFQESLTPDEAGAVRTTYGLQGYEKRAAEELKLPTQGAVLQGYENADEKQLRDLAFEKVKKLVPPGTPLAEAQKVFSAELQRFRDAKARETQARQGALADAGKAGAFESPTTVLPNQKQLQDIQHQKLWQETREQALGDLWREGKIPFESISKYALAQHEDPAIEKEISDRASFKAYGPPPKDNDTWLGKTVHGLATPSRAVSSGIAGAIDSVAERTSKPSPEEAQPAQGPSTVLDALLNPNYGFAGAAYKATTGKDLNLNGRVLGVKPSEAAQALTAEAQPREGLKEYLKDTLLLGPLGIPYANARGLAAMFPQTADSAVDAAQHAATQDSESSMYTLDYELKKRRDSYRGAAAQQVAQELPPGTPLDIAQKRFDEILNEYVRQDVGSPALNNPNAARLATELVADPLQLLPAAEIGAGVKKLVGAVASKIPVGKGATVLDKLREGFQYAPEYSKLPESMGDTALLGRLAAERAAVSTDNSIAGMEKLLPEMRKVSAEDRPNLFSMLEGKTPAEQVPERLRPAYESAQQLSEQHKTLRETTGIGQDWNDEGILAQPRLLSDEEGYVPHRILEDTKAPPIQDVLPERVHKPGMDAVLPKSTLEREGGGEWVKDPVAQWETELQQIRPKAQIAQEMRNMRNMFEQGGAMISSSAKYSPEESAKMTELMSKETGVEWIELPSNLEERFQRVTGAPGAIEKGGTSTFMPRPIAERLTALVKITDEKQAMSAFSDFNKAFIRPGLKLWRTSVTLPNPAFHTTNAAGSFALGFLAHGFRAFDPGIQAGAVSGALLSAVGEHGMQAAKAIPFELRSGKIVNLHDIIKAAEEDGVLNVFHLRQASEMQAAGTNAVTLGMKALNRGVDKVLTPLAKVGRGIDDYQHLTAYLGFLDDLTPVARARAADLTARFAGNYRRLGKADQFLKEGFGFYSWMRFVFPHAARQMLDNPDRMAAFAKFRGYMERANGPAAPAMPGGIPEELKGKGVTAPMTYQPEKLRKILASGKVPDLGSHEFAMMVLEDPINMGLAWVPLVEHAVKGKKGDARAETLANLLGPYWQAGIEMLSGRDLRTGEEIEGFGERSSRFAKSFVSRPVDAWKGLIELYSGSPEAADLALRYRVGRDFLGLEEPFVDELRSIPSPPGGKLFPVDPLNTGMDRQEAATKFFDERLRARKRDLR